MKNRTTLVLAFAVALVLGLYMTTYQVGFHEAAVLTTFGKAGADAVKNEDGQGAGLYWKLPWPIQEVRLFDTRVQVFETQLEQLQTKDQQIVVLNDYVAWRIARPLEFQLALKNVPTAEEQLRNRLRNARATINQYTFDELTNRDPAKLKLARAEQAIRKILQEEAGEKRYGVEIVAVGIKRVILPVDVTEKVFDQMRSTRRMLAQHAQSEGDVAANDIRQKAKFTRERVLAFVDSRVRAIRTEGDAAATQYYQVFKQNEELAIFLRQIEALKETLKQNTTFVLDTRAAPFDLLAPPGSISAPNK